MTISLPIAVVTGGARGIGKQLATDLLARGYHVVIGDLDLAVTQETARELGESVTAAQLDVTDPVSAAQLIEHVETELGPIDLWVNNAGIMPTEPFSTQDARVAQRIIAINYASVVSLTGLVLQRMLPRNRGTIVNMASATGIKPLAGVAVYSGTKAAVIAFSDALRRELRHTGLTITVVNPNLVTTAMGAGITPPALTGSDGCLARRHARARHEAFLGGGPAPTRPAAQVLEGAARARAGLARRPGRKRQHWARRRSRRPTRLRQGRARGLSAAYRSRQSVVRWAGVGALPAGRDCASRARAARSLSRLLSR